MTEKQILFILLFKQSITNITFEPWHWRYVGVEAAKEMKAKNLCLEEYLREAYSSSVN